MSVQLAILGFLREKDFYGYELKKVMERLMGHWSDIKFGSIYYALEKLTREGFVKPISEEKDGSNPARTIYRITDEGREAFVERLENVLTTGQMIYHPLDVGIFFSQPLGRDRVGDILRERAQRIDGALKFLTQHEKDLAADATVPEIATVMIEHAVVHMRAESEFLKELAERYLERDLFGGKQMGQYIQPEKQTGKAKAHPRRKALAK